MSIRPYSKDLFMDLQDPNEVVAYLNAAAREADTTAFLLALGNVVKSKGSIRTFAKKVGLGYAQIHRLLFSGKGNPTLRTLIKMVHALGYELTVKIVDKKEG